MSEKKTPRNLPSQRKLMREMAGIALDGEQKTADRIRALDLLSDFLLKEGAREDAMKKLDLLLEQLGK